MNSRQNNREIFTSEHKRLTGLGIALIASTARKVDKISDITVSHTEQ